MKTLPNVLFLTVLAALGSAPAGVAQGMVSGNRTAIKAEPLPEGAKIPTVRFKDVAEQAGLRAANVSGAIEHATYIVETTGTGVAIFDYDKDGLQDVLFVDADRFEEDSRTPRHHLYRNLGGLKFEDVTDRAGLVHTGWGQGVCVGDIDDDGYDDLLITHWGQDVLYRNQGDSTFSDETRERGLRSRERRWSTGCSFFDYDRDGDLDLFVAHYIDFDPAETPKPGEASNCRYRGMPTICGPMGLPGETMSLYQNDGHGVFTDVSVEAGIEVEKIYYGLTPLTGDFDNDGWPDVYVACDSTASLMFRNRGDGTFEEVGLLSGTAYNEHGVEQAGMGATTADVDGDGWLDIFKTNFSNDTNNFYRNEGDWLFTEEAVRFGLASEARYVGWGAAFLDFDHDGKKDLLVVNGHVYPEIDETSANETFRQPRLLYWNGPGNRFFDFGARAGTAFEARHSSRGIAVGDLDNDGSLEIVIVNLNEAPTLLKNEAAPAGHSLLVEVLTASGRSAIGARIAVKTPEGEQIGEVRSGGSYISQSDFRVHFGLGTHERAEVSIRWPSGESESYKAVPANRRLTYQQGKGLVKSLPFARR